MSDKLKEAISSVRSLSDADMAEIVRRMQAAADAAPPYRRSRDLTPNLFVTARDTLFLLGTLENHARQIKNARGMKREQRYVEKLIAKINAVRFSP